MNAKHLSTLLVLVLLVSAGCENESSQPPQATVERVAAPAAADSEDLPLPPCCPKDGSKAVEQTAAVESQPVEPAEQVSEEPGEQPQGARLSEWIEPADRSPFDLDYIVTNQNGKQMKLSDLVGKPFVMSWMYTRCPDPQMCPLIVSHFARLQQTVAVSGIGEKIQLVMISYDPVYDTPKRMLAYGKQRGIKFDGIPAVQMFRPQTDQFRSLLSEFQINLMPQDNGEFAHVYELIIADEQGRFVRDHQGQLWSNDQVVEDLKRILKEAESTATASLN